MFTRGLLVIATFLFACGGTQASHASRPQFLISYPSSAHSGAVTGRLLVIISRTNEPEVRQQVGWITSPPIFGIDVSQVAPDQSVVVDSDVPGYPLRGLREIPPGDYYVQAVLNVYTQFHRADGRVIWAHMDQWEGQKFNISPGNLYSKVQRLHLNRKYSIRISLTEVIPPIQVPADTQWVKHVKIQSALLSRFWGHPMYLGAVVLLPKDYEAHPDSRYPVVYQQGHFSHQAPFSYRTDPPEEEEAERRYRQNIGVETGYAFYKAWNADQFPRLIAVTLLHPTPYYDDSYAVNSANTGPYGDAIMTELIPYIEEHFRIIREPYARLLTGLSTGGWEALALQLYYPDFFGGTWSIAPDPVDLRRYYLLDIYGEENAYVLDPSRSPSWFRVEWSSTERPFVRSEDGQPITSLRQASQLEAVLGARGRSAGFLQNWEAVFGPSGDDGYPKPLWDRSTGRIDHGVAEYMRTQGFDLRDYAQRNWRSLGPKLAGKLHVYCSDTDNFYSNLGVYLFEQFLSDSRNPSYRGDFQYGRPLKGHGWQPTTNAELVKKMALEVARAAKSRR